MGKGGSHDHIWFIIGIKLFSENQLRKVRIDFGRIATRSCLGRRSAILNPSPVMGLAQIDTGSPLPYQIIKITENQHRDFDPPE
jgi:hypothetical protein